MDQSRRSAGRRPVNAVTIFEKDGTANSAVKSSVFRDTKYSLTGVVYHEQLHRLRGPGSFDNYEHGLIHARVLYRRNELRLNEYTIQYNKARYKELLGKVYETSFWNDSGRRY